MGVRVLFLVTGQGLGRQAEYSKGYQFHGQRVSDVPTSRNTRRRYKQYGSLVKFQRCPLFRTGFQALELQRNSWVLGGLRCLCCRPENSHQPSRDDLESFGIVTSLGEDEKSDGYEKVDADGFKAVQRGQDTKSKDSMSFS